MQPRAASPLWVPDVPEDFEFSSSSEDEHFPEEESQYCLDVDFGGPLGERLPLLNRVTPFLDNHGELRGMAFFYDDGTERVYGSRRTFGDRASTTLCSEPSFEIRGSAGERIIRIGYDIGKARLSRFQVRHPKHRTCALFSLLRIEANEFNC